MYNLEWAIKEFTGYTVPNDSYRFWAVLHLDGHVYGVANIHKYWSKMP